MPPTELPGYYYDEAKKKYFRILENHAVPLSSNYSRSGIKRETELALARKRQQDRERLEREQTIQHSKVLQRSLLTREIDCRKDGTAVRWDVWAEGLERKEAIRVEIDNCCDITHFVFDELTASFVIAGDCRLITGIPIFNRDSGKHEYQVNLVAFMNDRIFSIALSPSRVLMTVGSEGLTGATVRIDRLASPQTLSPYTRRRLPPELRDTVPELTHNGSIQLRSRRLTDFWASAACPHSTRSDFALATSEGTILVVENQTGWAFGRHQLFESANHSGINTDVLAVDWQSINVVLSGCRDKTVRLWDVRVGEPHGTSLRLRHPTTINHMRRLNDNSVIVAGMEGQLCTYDLRFLPNSATSHGADHTRPFTTFPEYGTYAHQMLSVGFDVSNDVVAAGIAEGSEYYGVQLFDAKSGRQMSASVRNEYTGGAPPRCVKLIGGSHLWPTPSLMYTSWNVIREWR